MPSQHSPLVVKPGITLQELPMHAPFINQNLIEEKDFNLGSNPEMRDLKNKRNIKIETSVVNIVNMSTQLVLSHQIPCKTLLK